MQETRFEPLSLRKLADSLRLPCAGTDLLTDYLGLAMMVKEFEKGCDKCRHRRKLLSLLSDSNVIAMPIAAVPTTRSQPVATDRKLTDER